MNAAQLPAFVPLLPEIVLALGAMALLMLGAFRVGLPVRVVDFSAIALLVAAGVILAAVAWGQA